MSVFKKIGNQVGKVASGLGEAAHDIGDAAKEVGKGFKGAIEKSEEKVKKCPGCGQEMSAFTSKCPLCGYELTKVKTSGNISKLAEDIKKLEEKRNIKAELRASKKANTKVSPTDEKIASLIRNFVVPNNIEDIFDFMMMASGNMDVYQTNISVSGNPAIVRQAWEAKFEQTYQKAKILFDGQTDFKKIQDIYDKQHSSFPDSIGNMKKKKLFGRK